MRFEQVITYIITGLFGTGLFYMGMSQGRKGKACKEKVEGVCMEKFTYTPPATSIFYYKIKFAYIYNGKKYTKSAVEEFPRKNGLNLKLVRFIHCM